MDKQTEGGFTRLLESYQTAAVHSLSAILQSLIAWRKRSMLDWTNWTELGCPHIDSRVQPLLDEKKIVSSTPCLAMSHAPLLVHAMLTSAPCFLELNRLPVLPAGPHHPSRLEPRERPVG